MNFSRVFVWRQLQLRLPGGKQDEGSLSCATATAVADGECECSQVVCTSGQKPSCVRQ
jgi:hypothetical protein